MAVGRHVLTSGKEQHWLQTSTTCVRMRIRSLKGGFLRVAAGPEDRQHQSRGRRHHLCSQVLQLGFAG